MLPNMRPSGNILILSLILLSIMMMLSISGTNNSLLTERAENTQRLFQTTFLSADSAVSEGEKWLFAQTIAPRPVVDCYSPPCQVMSKENFKAANLVAQSSSWWNTQGRPLSFSLGNNANPLFMIVSLEDLPDELDPQLASKGQGIHYYNVYGYSAGTQQSTVLLESLYAIRYQ